MDIPDWIFVSNLLLLSYFFFVTVFNFFTVKILKKDTSKKDKSLVSILIPMRNEEENAEKCIRSVLRQSYKNFEVIAVDDKSKDNTLKILQKIANKNSKLQIIKGEEKPGGWIGKSWALHQATAVAKGKYFLFLDADTFLNNYALESALSIIEGRKIGMLTCLPTQHMKSFGEYLYVPIFLSWAPLSFIPFKITNLIKNKFINQFTVFTCGQFILMSSEIYIKIGGHKAIYSKLSDDLELGRLVKKEGYEVLICVDNNLVSCRMYHNLKEAIKGFTRSFAYSINIPPVLFIMIGTTICLSFILPLMLFVIDFRFLILVIMIIGIRILLAIRSKENVIFNIVLHPLQMLVMIFLIFYSQYQKVIGELKWKGRSVGNM